MRKLLIILSIWLLVAGVATADSVGLTNAFFAMDTGTRDAQHQSPTAQAQLLKDLGYAGIGWSPGQVSEMLAALDQRGLEMFTVYAGLEIGSGATNTPETLVRLLHQLKGRDTILWLPITSKKHKPSSPEGDAEAVAVLRDLANHAQAANLKIALYPHTWFWLERVQDAVRVVRQVNRPNVGVTFNLCHALKVGDVAQFPQLLAEARPYLFVVTINGADQEGDWDRLIQPLDSGTFNQAAFLKALKNLGYTGPIGLQHYGIKGDARDNLRRSLTAWRQLSGESN